MDIAHIHIVSLIAGQECGMEKKNGTVNVHECWKQSALQNRSGLACKTKQTVCKYNT